MTASRPRLRRAVVMVALALLGVASTGCQTASGGDGPPQTLTIVSSDWNGWDPDHRPTPETTTLSVDVGATVSVDGLGGGATFEVVEVDDGEVEMSSDVGLAPTGDTGGRNLNDLVEEFTVAQGEETVLGTPTLDAGSSFTLTLAPTTRAGAGDS